VAACSCRRGVFSRERIECLDNALSLHFQRSTLHGSYAREAILAKAKPLLAVLSLLRTKNLDAQRRNEELGRNAPELLLRSIEKTKKIEWNDISKSRFNSISQHNAIRNVS